MDLGEQVGVIRKHMESEGEGALSMVLDEDGEWVVSVMFGREAPDSDMAGGAAYATGSSLTECLSSVLDETGWT